MLLVAVDQESLTNCCPVQTNRRFIGGGYGADLQFTPASFVYQVAIADTAHIYAGATVSNLNGATPGDLDVVLFHVPSSGVGTLQQVVPPAKCEARFRDIPPGAPTRSRRC